MHRFQSDDENAFKELFERYESRLLGFFYQFIANRQEAEDLLHDLFIKLINNKQQYNTERPFEPWIFRIASNLAKSHLKKMRRLHFEHPDRMEFKTNVNGVDRIALQKDIRAALLKIDETHRITFILRHYHKLSIKEIAEILECKEGTIKSRLFTANQKLKIELENNQIALNYE